MPHFPRTRKLPPRPRFYPPCPDQRQIASTASQTASTAVKTGATPPRAASAKTLAAFTARLAVSAKTPAVFTPSHPCWPLCPLLPDGAAASTGRSPRGGRAFLCTAEGGEGAGDGARSGRVSLQSKQPGRGTHDEEPRRVRHEGWCIGFSRSPYSAAKPPLPDGRKAMTLPRRRFLAGEK